MADDVPAPTKVIRLLHTWDDSSLFKTRRCNLTTHKRCAPGKDIVDVLVKQVWCHSRQDATNIGKMLCNKGLLFHVTYHHTFSDSPHLYRCANNATISYIESLEQTMTPKLPATKPLSIPSSSPSLDSSAPTTLPGSLTASMISQSLLAIHHRTSSSGSLPLVGDRMSTDLTGTTLGRPSHDVIAAKQQLMVTHANSIRNNSTRNSSFLRKLFDESSGSISEPNGAQSQTTTGSPAIVPNTPNSGSIATLPPATKKSSSGSIVSPDAQHKQQPPQPQIVIREDWFDVPKTTPQEANPPPNKPPTPTATAASQSTLLSDSILGSISGSVDSSQSDFLFIDPDASPSVASSLTSDDFSALNAAVALGHRLSLNTQLNQPTPILLPTAPTPQLRVVVHPTDDEDDRASTTSSQPPAPGQGFFASLIHTMKSKSQRSRLTQYCKQLQTFQQRVESERKRARSHMQKARDHAHAKVRELSKLGLTQSVAVERAVAHKQMCAIDVQVQALDEVARVLAAQLHVTKRILGSDEVSPSDVPPSFFRKPAEIAADVMKQHGITVALELKRQAKTERKRLQLDRQLSQASSNEQETGKGLGRSEVLIGLLDQMTSIIEDIRNTQNSANHGTGIVVQDDEILSYVATNDDAASRVDDDTASVALSDDTSASTLDMLLTFDTPRPNPQNWNSRGGGGGAGAGGLPLDAQLAMRARRGGQHHTPMPAPVRMDLEEAVRDFLGSSANKRRSSDTNAQTGKSQTKLSNNESHSPTSITSAPCTCKPKRRDPPYFKTIPLTTAPATPFKPTPVKDSELGLHLFRVRSEYVELEQRFSLWLLDQRFPDSHAILRFFRVVLATTKSPGNCKPSECPQGSACVLPSSTPTTQCSPMDVVGFLEQYWRSVAERYAVTNPALEMALVTLIQGVIFDRVGVDQFHRISLSTQQEDELFRHNARWVKTLPPAALDVHPKFCKGDAVATREVYRRAIDCIEDLELLVAPADMLLCVFECAKLIIMDGCNNAGCDTGEFGADCLLPILVFVISCASLHTPKALVAYIQSLSNPEDISSELGYYFVGFEVAVTFVCTADPASYAKDLGDFDVVTSYARGIERINAKFENGSAALAGPCAAEADSNLSSLMRHMEITDNLESLGF